jgi:7,8-dihydropterin-6-yl-methyl-4-(beta-D-ribofuranosyl)aminobenzene 5'-phosphate synthase
MRAAWVGSLKLVCILGAAGLLLSIAAGCWPDNPSLGETSLEGFNQVTQGAIASATVETLPVLDASLTPSATALTEVVTQTPAERWETPIPMPQSITITIVFDNNVYDPRLKTAWGFSAMIEYLDQCLLFDTGGDGQILLENMRILGIDPNQIEAVVLSHAHGDHTGGLSALLELEARPTVYLLPSFPKAFITQVGRVVDVVEVTPGLLLGAALYTTGEMSQNIPEQALVIKTDQGLVIITGCAHPGIVEIVKQARSMYDEKVRLVLGGFHLGSKSKAEIGSILKEFRRLGVEQVAPCHCTGETAIAMFAAEYGEAFIPAGAGRIIRLEFAAPN